MLRLTIMVMVVLWLCSEEARGGSVFIYNNLRRGNLLKVHCKSGDNDLGYHVRRPGRLYNYSFSDHILDKTLFWCHLWQGRNFSINQTIVAYEGKRLPQRDNWVRWSVRQDGIYESVDAKPFQFTYNWGNQL